MLSVILIWIYVGITTFIMGYGVLRVITRHLPYYAHVCTENIAADAAGRRREGRRLCPMRQSADSYFMCGLVCVTVYAQFFSLFAGVGLWANVILCAACTLTVLVDKKAFTAVFRQMICSAGCSLGGGTGQESGLTDAGGRAKYDDGTEGTAESGLPNGGKRIGRSGALRLCAVLVVFLLFAYGTSRGMIHYDTGLYHAQSIRWIEEYGVVKGLGNLHCRLAYNSSSFALSALYSMAFLGGQSYHCTAGWLAFLLAAVCLRIGKSLRAGRLRSSDFARVMCVYYLVNIFDEMISPASDYFMVLVAFYIVIKWLDLSERGEETLLPYALLCVLGVFLMTVKLSAALILLLTVYPACRLLREKRWGETGVYLGLGILTALPFFIRNVIISGWLVYPFTQMDLFDVVWKIPKGIADYDAREIQVWGRGYTDVSQFDMPVREWLPGWFAGLAGSDKVLVLGAAAAVFVLLTEAAYLVCGRRTAAAGRFARWRVQGDSDGTAAQKTAAPIASESLLPPVLLTVQATVAASFLFWLCTSPLIRYGCVWVYLTAAVIFGGICEAVMCFVERGKRSGADSQRQDESAGGTESGRRIAGERSDPRGNVRGWRTADSRQWRFAVGWAASAAVILLLAYKGFALTREIAGSYVNDYWLVQKDYENYETRSYEIAGVTFYRPAEGDQTGYDSFPSSPSEADIVFLGERIADGFRAADPL